MNASDLTIAIDFTYWHRFTVYLEGVVFATTRDVRLAAVVSAFLGDGAVITYRKGPMPSITDPDVANGCPIGGEFVVWIECRDQALHTRPNDRVRVILDMVRQVAGSKAATAARDAIAPDAQSRGQKDGG